MEIELRFFAIIREIVGRPSERRVIDEPATVGGLFEQLVVEYPKLERLKPVTMLMVNQAYVGADHMLSDGDEVALIPPVSGGSGRLFRVQAEPLDSREAEIAVGHPGAGAIVTFVGTVRDHGRGRVVTELEYEAYGPAAERTLEQIGNEINERWSIEHVAIVHRIGALQVGEASVVISVAAPHREAAFDACRYAIERIKEFVPIWKKEHYSDGAVWVGSELEYQKETGRVR